MTHEFSISYLNCQSCTAKIHCEKCADELKERFAGKGGLSEIEMNSAGMDEWDILDMLEEAGIFAD